MARRAPASAAPTGLPVRELQLATLVDAAPDGDAWLHEVKFDGYRIVAVIEDGAVRLWSRTFKDWTAEFPTVVAALARLPVTRAILDGELAAVMPDGRTRFGGLRDTGGDDGGQLAYFVFDLLAVDGESLVEQPLEARKARLAALIARVRDPARIVRYSDHVVGGGPAFFDAACQRGLEGIVSKRRDAPYRGGRGTAWVKTKCMQRQELVIGGFTEPEGSRTGLGALLVGVYDGDRLAYAGKVGTGFTAHVLDELRAELEPLIRATSPFEPAPARALTGPGVHWVRPALVAEVSFMEWTGDGRLRHPSFKGLRRDKPPTAVVRERPGRIA